MSVPKEFFPNYGIGGTDEETNPTANIIPDTPSGDTDVVTGPAIPAGVKVADIFVFIKNSPPLAGDEIDPIDLAYDVVQKFFTATIGASYLGVVGDFRKYKLTAYNEARKVTPSVFQLASMESEIKAIPELKADHFEYAGIEGPGILARNWGWFLVGGVVIAAMGGIFPFDSAGSKRGFRG